MSVIRRKARRLRSGNGARSRFLFIFAYEWTCRLDPTWPTRKLLLDMNLFDAVAGSIFGKLSKRQIIELARPSVSS